MRKRLNPNLNVSQLNRFEILSKIRDGEISIEELTSRAENVSRRRSFLFNKYLLQGLEEAVILLREHGVKIRSVNELLHHIAVAFLETLARTEIPSNEKELVISPNIQFIQMPIIRERCNMLRNTLCNTSEDNKYREVRTLLNIIRMLQGQIEVEKNERKRLLLRQALENNVGRVLELLAGDDSERAKRYRALAKSVLKGIQAYFEEEIE